MSAQLGLTWLAGLMEGEGCFSLHHPKREKDKGYPGAPKLQLKMTDKDVMERAARIFNCPLYGPYRNKNNKDGSRSKEYYLVQLTTTLSVPWMRLLCPLLGERRQEKIKELLEYKKNNCKYRGWNGRATYEEFDPK